MRDRMTAYSQSLIDERFKDMRFLKQALFQFLLAEAGDDYFAALAAQLNRQPRNN